MVTEREKYEKPDPGPDEPDQPDQGQADRGLFADTSELLVVLAAAVQDVARLLRLEARLLVRALLIMTVLTIFLALVLAAAWVALSAAIGLALYQYAGLGMVGAAAVCALLNLVVAIATGLALKRLARRLTFPETRYAWQTFWLEAGQQSK